MTMPKWQTGTVESFGEQIYFEVTGDDDSPAIVLTHGAGGSHAAWFQQVPVLAHAGYRVITWDCRGFGNSTFTTGVHGCDAAVADIGSVLNELHVDRTHLAGQSMGGWWVTAFTLAHPQRVRSLTLSNTPGGMWTDGIRAHFAEWRGSALDTDPARLGVHSALSPTFPERDPARAFLYQSLNTFHSPPMAAIGQAITGTRFEHEALDATGVPVLVITSADDVLFPAPLLIESASRLRNASIVEIADAGHSVYFERPDEYNETLLKFVAQAPR
jgi:3-oxoadipate enol-lactonase